MIVEDWRDANPAELEPLYRAECERYLARLAWDLAPSMAIVEEARRSGRLPGLLLRAADGAVVGWTFFLVHERILQIGAMAADTAAGLRRLVDRVLQSPEAALARSFTGFLFPVSPSLVCALERQRFDVERHPYLSRRLQPGADVNAEPRQAGPVAQEFRIRRLSEVHPADVVRLAARAYVGLPEARCFAPDGRLEQWAHYLGQLMATPACGRYLPEASFAVDARDGARLQGAVITTALSTEAAHIAQIVVDPDCRGAGLGRALVERVAAASRSAGYSRLTLIVAEQNERARRLYARLGFEESASFFFASRPALMRRSWAARLPVPA